MLLATGVLGYWAVSEHQRATSTTEPARHAALPLVADSSLPDPRHRLLDEVTIELGGPVRSQFALQRRRDGRHTGFYVTPPGWRAEDAEVESLLSALLSAVAERRLSPDAASGHDYTAYGVGEEQCRVRVRFGAGHSLCFGADSPSGSVYVRADRAPTILVVERALFELLARPPTHYRSSRLVLLPLTNAHKIDLGTLHLFHDGDLWRVQKADGSWVLAEPTGVEELVQRLARWPVSADIPAEQQPGNLPTSDPPLRLTIDGEEVLRGGWPCPWAAAPTMQRFVRSDGAVVCAGAPAVHQLLPQWAELRAQRLLAVTSAQVARLQLSPSVDVVRQPEGRYAQSGRPADTSSVLHILALLTQRRSLGEAGAALPPAAAVRIVVTTVLGQSITLQLWQDGTRALVQRDHEPAQLLDEPVPELRSLTPLSFAPLQLLSIEPAAVRQLTRSGTAHEVLERRAGWHLRAPTVAPADSAAVEDLLAVLTDLRAARWVSLQPRPEYGLDPPQLRFVITLAPGHSGASGNTGAAGKKESAEKKESGAGGAAAAAPELGLEVGGRASEPGDCYVRRRPGAPVAVLPAATCATLGQPLLSPLLVRLDDDRLTAVQLTPSSAPTAARSCTRYMTATGSVVTARSPPRPSAALLTALHALQRGERPTYAPSPAAPPRFTLHLLHTRRLPARLCARPFWDLRPTSAKKWRQRNRRCASTRLPMVDSWSVVDQRDVTYHLPNSAFSTLQDALASVRPGCALTAARLKSDALPRRQPRAIVRP